MQTVCKAKHIVQILVVKIGGSVLENEYLLEKITADIKTILNTGISIAVLHGGGKAIEKRTKELGKTTSKINGLRVTDAETLRIVIEELSNINKIIAAKLSASDTPAIGFTAPANLLFAAEKFMPKNSDGKEVDAGFVGKVTGCASSMLKEAFLKGAVPVIAPLGLNKTNQIFNINADHAAIALAKSINATKLINITDVPGLLLNPADHNSLISSLSLSQAEAMLLEGKIEGGMLPKLESCVEALKAGLESVQIVSGLKKHVLFEAAFAEQAPGTLIYSEANS